MSQDVRFKLNYKNLQESNAKIMNKISNKSQKWFMQSHSFLKCFEDMQDMRLRDHLIKKNYAWSFDINEMNMFYKHKNYLIIILIQHLEFNKFFTLVILLYNPLIHCWILFCII